MTNETTERKGLVLNRVFDAPRELVWEAWTQAEHLKQWFGPEGFTTPVAEVDLRIGGELRITMRGPDGTDYPMKGIFEELIPPERLVMLTSTMEDANGVPALEVRTTVTFEAQSEKTAVTVQAVVIRATDEAKPALQGMKEGWTGTLDKLGKHLAEAK